MGEKEDIEIVIATELNTVEYIEYKYERYFYNAKTGRRVAFRYFFNHDEGLNQILHSVTYNTPIDLYKNGRIESIGNRLDNCIYKHEYYKTGGTSRTYYHIKSTPFHQEKGYTKTGRTNYKISYDKDWEKRSRIFYWHGPRLPEEEGHMVRYDRRGEV
jgi:hypothetical protein